MHRFTKQNIGYLIEKVAFANGYDVTYESHLNELGQNKDSKHEEWVIYLTHKLSGNNGGCLFTTREALHFTPLRWEEFIERRMHEAFRKIIPVENPCLKQREAYMMGSFVADRPKEEHTPKGRWKRSDPNYKI